MPVLILQRLLSPDLGLESVEVTNEEEDWACCPWPRPLYLLLLRPAPPAPPAPPATHRMWVDACWPIRSNPASGPVMERRMRVKKVDEGELSQSGFTHFSRCWPAEGAHPPPRLSSRTAKLRNKVRTEEPSLAPAQNDNPSISVTRATARTEQPAELRRNHIWILGGFSLRNHRWRI